MYGFVLARPLRRHLEMIKPVAGGRAGDDEERAATRSVRAAACLRSIVALLHPFMPFLTEEIWEKLTGQTGTLIVTSLTRVDAVLFVARRRRRDRARRRCARS